VPAGVDRSIYLYKGDLLQVADEQLKGYHAADLADQMDIQLKNGTTVSEILVLQGRPIKEPVVQHGPFVGNTRNDIQQAFLEYNKTQFGGWPWPEHEYVHSKEKGRFALLNNSRIMLW
jgi:redox-sensitive bicupin YhaK (pirin superfamily)